MHFLGYGQQREKKSEEDPNNDQTPHLILIFLAAVNPNLQQKTRLQRKVRPNKLLEDRYEKDINQATTEWSRVISRKYKSQYISRGRYSRHKNGDVSVPFRLNGHGFCVLGNSEQCSMKRELNGTVLPCCMRYAWVQAWYMRMQLLHKVHCQRSQRC